MPHGIVHRATFNASFRYGNMLQVFDSDSKTCNTLAQVLHGALKIVSCDIPSPTVAATKLLLKLSREI